MTTPALASEANTDRAARASETAFILVCLGVCNRRGGNVCDRSLGEDYSGGIRIDSDQLDDVDGIEDITTTETKETKMHRAVEWTRG
jgi:hypothetical protein